MDEGIINEGGEDKEIAKELKEKHFAILIIVVNEIIVKTVLEFTLKVKLVRYNA